MSNTGPVAKRHPVHAVSPIDAVYVALLCAVTNTDKAAMRMPIDVAICGRRAFPASGKRY